MAEHGLLQIFDYLDDDRSGDVTIEEYANLHHRQQMDANAAAERETKQHQQRSLVRRQTEKPAAVYAPGEDPPPAAYAPGEDPPPTYAPGAMQHNTGYHNRPIVSGEPQHSAGYHNPPAVVKHRSDHGMQTSHKKSKRESVTDSLNKPRTSASTDDENIMSVLRELMARMQKSREATDHAMVQRTQREIDHLLQKPAVQGNTKMMVALQGLLDQPTSGGAHEELDLAVQSFNLFDTNRDDKVTMTEFVIGSGQQASNSGHAQTTFHQIDKDGNRVLSLSEFKSSASIIHSSRNINEDRHLVGSDNTHHEKVQHFAAIDDDHDSWISRREVEKHLSKHLGNANAIILFADKDNDGRLSSSEYDELYFSPTSNVKQLAHFTSNDLNGDGYLSLDEFLAHSPTSAARSLRRWEFHHLDIDIDGKLSFQEVLKTTHQMEAPQPPKLQQEASKLKESHADDEHVFEFYQFDRNGDNYINDVESKAAGLSMKLDADKDERISLQEYLDSFSADAALQEQKDEYIQMDENMDGHIDRSEFLKNVAPDPGTPDIVHFRNHDRDRNGWLSFDEVFPGTSDPDWVPIKQVRGYEGHRNASHWHPISDETDDNVYHENQHNFNVLDANGDGRVSQPELLAHIAPSKGTCADQHFKNYDTDGSGWLSFAEIFPNTPIPRKKVFKTLPEQFDHMDQNGDEFIDIQEYHHMHGHFKTEQYFDKLDRDGDGQLSFFEIHGYDRPHTAAPKVVHQIQI